MKKIKKMIVFFLVMSFLVPNYAWVLQAEEDTHEKTVNDKDTIYYILKNEVLENYYSVKMPFDSSLDGYTVTWSIQGAAYDADTTPVYFLNEDAKRLSTITTTFNQTNLYFNAPGTVTIDAVACKTTNAQNCQPKKSFNVKVENPELNITKSISELRYLQEEDELILELEGQEASNWKSYYDITWQVKDADIVRLYDISNDVYTNELTFSDAKTTLYSVQKGNTLVKASIVNKKNANIKASVILTVNVKDLLSDTMMFINNDDIRIEVGGFVPFYTAQESTQSVQNISTANGVAVGFKNREGQVNFDSYRDLINMRIHDESIVRMIPYVKYNGMNIPLEEANKEAQSGQKFYAFQGLKPGSTVVTFNYGNKVISARIRVGEKLNNKVELDPSGDERTNEVVFNISSEALKQTTGDSKPRFSLNLTKSAIDSMVMSSKEPNVKVSIRIPEEVRMKADIEKILISKNTLEAVRNYEKKISFRIANESDKLLYSWSFNGLQMKEVGSDLDLSLEKKKVSEAYKIDALAADTNATLVVLHHEGVLPSQATIRLYVGDMGYKSKDKVYLYYHDELNNELTNELKKENGFLVDEDLYIEFPITHCSNYVLTTKPMDEKKLTVNAPESDIVLEPLIKDEVVEDNIRNGRFLNSTVENITTDKNISIKDTSFDEPTVKSTGMNLLGDTAFNWIFILSMMMIVEAAFIFVTSKSKSK